MTINVYVIMCACMYLYRDVCVSTMNVYVSTMYNLNSLYEMGSKNKCYI